MAGKTVYRNYKDNVFCLLFREKAPLLEVYNAINGTEYKSTDGLTVATLPNTICIQYRNDAAYTFNSDLSLYEQQSTDNPNIPLRALHYISEEYRRIIPARHLYRRTGITIPVPHFIVFYNGAGEQPEAKVYKLSDLFEKQTGEPELEVKVTVLNINEGKNAKLLSKCKALRGYMAFVRKVRENKKNMDTEAAVRAAVEACIQEGILASFFRKHKEEVIDVGIFEFDEELYKEAMFEDGVVVGRKEGHKEGRKEGRTEERNTFAKLSSILISEKKQDDLIRAATDNVFYEQLLSEYGFSSQLK